MGKANRSWLNKYNWRNSNANRDTDYHWTWDFKNQLPLSQLTVNEQKFAETSGKRGTSLKLQMDTCKEHCSTLSRQLQPAFQPMNIVHSHSCKAATQVSVRPNGKSSLEVIQNIKQEKGYFSVELIP